MPLELHDLNWDLGFGHIQTTIGPWSTPGWVRVARDANTPLPVGLPPGGTLPMVPDSQRAQVPDVVLGASGPTIIGVPRPVDLPSGKVDTRQAKEDDEMAVDWGTVLSGAIDIYQGQQVGGGRAYSPLTSFGSAGPVMAPIPNVGTGDPPDAVWRKCKRRRSRPMLTPTNMALLQQIGTLPNNANVRIALAKSIRRN